MVVNGTLGQSILVVDDVPDTLQLLTDWLESHQYATLAASSGAEAIKLAQEHHPDLILLDVMMPKMDGIETCRLLKAHPETASIPIILVTAKNPSDARAEGMMAGASDYITKPVNLEDLTARVRSALDTNQDNSVELHRLLEEVSHSAMTILSSELVWLLTIEGTSGNLSHRALTTNAGKTAEKRFLDSVSAGREKPEFSLRDNLNPVIKALTTRQTLINLPVKEFMGVPSTAALGKALEQLRLGYCTVMPLIAAGKSSGVMMLGSYQQRDMESPRARQILSSLGSQAAIVVDYSRLIVDLGRREQEMRREQAFRQMILDTMGDGLVVIDSTGEIKYVNRRLLRMTNYPNNHLEGRSVGELFHPEDRDEVMFGLLREGAPTMKFEQRLITRENRVVPVLLSRSHAQTNQMNNQVLVLSDMTAQKEREAVLQRQSARLIALNKASQAISANLSLEDTLQNILRSAVEVVEAQGASLFLINKEKPDELIVVAAVGENADVMSKVHVPLGEGVAGWVAREAQSQLVSDTESDKRFYKGVDEKTGMQTHSLIAVPLITSDRVIGVIEVINKFVGTFDSDDVRLLESIASTAAVSIENARLFDQSQRRVNELATLLGASAAASSTLQFSHVLEHIARNLAEGLKIERCLITSWNREEHYLESLAEVADGFWPAETGPTRPLSEEPLTRAALTSGMAVVASLLDNHIDRADRFELEATGMISMLAVPLWMDKRIVGLVNLYGIDPRISYDDRDVEMVDQLTQTWQHSLPVGASLATADEHALTELVRKMMAVGKTNWVTIQTWNPEDDFTRVIREMGFAEWTHRRGILLHTDKFPTMQDVIQNSRIRMETIDSLDSDPEERRWLENQGGRSCLMVPLIAHGEAIGMVKLVDTADRREFDTEEVGLAQGIANVVSNALENARLYQSLESRAKALESAYSELQEVDKEKDEFIQNVSHELRTPLIHVLGYAELLVEGEFGPVTEEQQDALRTVVDKSQKLADLVKDIVSVQAMETQSFNRVPTDLVQLMRQTLEQSSGVARNAGLRIGAALPANLPLVMVDEEAIVDAFKKLIDNAMKFGKDGERIEVIARDTDGLVVQVSIRDYGIGIDPSEHSKIFRRFYQVDGGINRKYAGTGLGLAVTKQVIEGHGGRIWVESKLGAGATFHFTLPKAEAVS